MPSFRDDPKGGGPGIHFQRLVFMDSGLSASPIPGMTVVVEGPQPEARRVRGTGQNPRSVAKAAASASARRRGVAGNGDKASTAAAA